ncbi:MAG TPA: YMGG-like glycine zipper-containing protein, partial [Chloroflexia bacterium]|nr:YMGG-like glycine zipper-containing protein [Chloroflexia bacterium]
DDGADGEVGVAPEPPHATWGGEALGAAAGAIAGGVLGAVVGGPLGAAVGVAVGGGAGSGAVHLASEPNTGPRGTEIGAGTGALVGGIMGSPGGPLGAAVGAALGAALGGASGELVQDATEEIIAEREAVAAHSREEAALAEVPSGASAHPAAGSLPVPDTGATRALGATVSADSAPRAATPAMMDTAVPQAAPATGHDGGPATATPYRGAGDAARSASPQSIEILPGDQPATRDLGVAPTSTDRGPQGIDTEYRSGGDGPRGGTIDDES